MRTRYLLLTLLLAGSVRAGESAAAGSPMAWRYRSLETAQDAFDAQAPTRAPGATLVFRLPRVDGAQTTGDLVEIVRGERHDALPMVSATAFSLAGDPRAANPDAMVVVADRYFRKGEFNLPDVEVRSPGLPDGVRRMGDLRLACEAQTAMAKEEGLKARAVLAAAGLFGLDPCGKQRKVSEVDAPASPYDTVTVEEGARRLTLRATDANLATLGDRAWSDDALVVYTLHGNE